MKNRDPHSYFWENIYSTNSMSDVHTILTLDHMTKAKNQDFYWAAHGHIAVAVDHFDTPFKRALNGVSF